MRRWALLLAAPVLGIFLGATAIAVLAALTANACSTPSDGSGDQPSPAAISRIPALLLPIYEQVGAQYDIPLGGTGMAAGTLTPRVDVTYQSAVFFTDLFNYGQPGYALVNARVTWTDPEGKWSVSAYGTNLTNEYYYYGKLSLQTALGFDQANPAPPAEWGLTVKRNF